MQKNLAEKIIEKDPNGLVVLDDNLKIVKFNKAFLKIFALKNTTIAGKNVNKVLGDTFFPNADITDQHSQIKEHSATGRFVNPITFKLEDEKMYACFFVDITDHMHMQVAQQIASLLGETTAESKISLLNLIKIIENNEIDE
jgi:transcriptional regulator with PAS, ATPase and Fis domain